MITTLGEVRARRLSAAVLNPDKAHGDIAAPMEGIPSEVFNKLKLIIEHETESVFSCGGSIPVLDPSTQGRLDVIESVEGKTDKDTDMSDQAQQNDEDSFHAPENVNSVPHVSRPVSVYWSSERDGRANKVTLPLSNSDTISSQALRAWFGLALQQLSEEATRMSWI